MPLNRTCIGYNCRTLVNGDARDLGIIDRRSSRNPLRGEALLATVRLGRASCLIAEDCRGRAVGFLFHLRRCRRRAADVLRFAVDPDHRRLGVGSMLFARLEAKSWLGAPCRMTYACRETDLARQLFLRSRGWLAVGWKRNELVVPGGGREDAILFEKRLELSGPHL